VLGVDWRIGCDAEPVGAARAASTAQRATVPAPSRDPWDGGPPPEPPAEPEDDIPDDYGEPLDPAATSTAPRDPEQVALELLSAQLGARPLDPQG
jgi:DNA polymerase-3 subunit gamma/tau